MGGAQEAAGIWAEAAPGSGEGDERAKISLNIQISVDCDGSSFNAGLGTNVEAFAEEDVIDPEPQDIDLTVEALKVRGLQKAQLTWTGTSAAQVDVYRNGAKTTTVADTGAYLDNINNRGQGTYTY